MPTLDIFNNDAFSVQSLTAAINQAPDGQSVPTLLDSLYAEEGIITTAVSIERDGDSLALVPAGTRGAVADLTVGEKRDMLDFSTIQLATSATVLADEVQNVRAFGKESEVETVLNLVNKRAQKMRRRIESTITYHRVGAITGKVFDANGTKVLLDVHSRFGIVQQEVNFDLATSTSNVMQKIRDAKRKAEDALGDSGMITGWIAVCGRTWYDALISHQKVEKAFERWNDGQFMRQDNRVDFAFGGVNFKEFYGKVGNIDFIGMNDAYLIPMGVADMFISRFAPADYMETVNTLGLPFYVKHELLRMDKGVELEAQSNPLNLCTRPKAIIRLKAS